jgi:hypothetical protein
MSSDLELDRCRLFIDSTSWNVDSSIPEIPQEYTVRGKATAGVEPPPIESHDWFAGQIREHGHRARFERWSYLYLELDGWKYWVVGNVINRERLTAPAE